MGRRAAGGAVFALAGGYGFGVVAGGMLYLLGCVLSFFVLWLFAFYLLFLLPVVAFTIGVGMAEASHRQYLTTGRVPPAAYFGILLGLLVFLFCLPPLSAHPAALLTYWTADDWQKKLLILFSLYAGALIGGLARVEDSRYGSLPFAAYYTVHPVWGYVLGGLTAGLYSLFVNVYLPFTTGGILLWLLLLPVTVVCIVYLVAQIALLTTPLAQRGDPYSLQALRSGYAPPPSHRWNLGSFWAFLACFLLVVACFLAALLLSGEREELPVKAAQSRPAPLSSIPTAPPRPKIQTAPSPRPTIAEIKAAQVRAARDVPSLLGSWMYPGATVVPFGTTMPGVEYPVVGLQTPDTLDAVLRYYRPIAPDLHIMGAVFLGSALRPRDGRRTEIRIQEVHIHGVRSVFIRFDAR